MSVESHFAKTDPTVRTVYQRLIKVAQAFGPVMEDPKKTSIHLIHHVTFAGVATRRSSLILTLKSASDIRNPRIEKRERTSANRWHLEVRLEKPAHIDRQVTMWLSAACDLAAPRRLWGGLGPIPSYRGGAQRPTTQPAMAPNTIPVTRIGA
jgi:Domain of unknown function (DUF5655)